MIVWYYLFITFLQCILSEEQPLLQEYTRNTDLATLQNSYTTAAITKNIPSSQLTALQDFYNSTNGPVWHYYNLSATSQIWNFSQPDPNPCADDWQGVTCICLPNCVVSELVLNRHNLSGTIPETIGNLENLKVLSLANNNISGTIPSNIGRLKSLLVLDLLRNLMNGRIPASLEELASLEVLNLESNYFQSIDDNAFNLPSTRTFQVGYNLISGTIPPNIGNLSNVHLITLVNNFFTSSFPKEFYKLKHLTTIDFSYNNISGSLSNRISTFQNLTFIAGNVNQLEGSIPSSIGEIQNLSVVFLYQNYLRGSIPTEFFNLKRLKTLDLVNNLLSQSLPENIGNLTHLATLYLAENSFTGSIPPAISNLQILNLIEIYDNFFLGKPARIFESMGRLIYFDVGENLLSGSIPFGDWPNIYVYEGNLNYFTGSIPTVISNYTYLNYMDYGENYLTGALPSELSSNHRIEYFNFSTNLLTGTLPREYSELIQMGQFSLFNNFLSGTIPSEYGDLLTLVIFSFYSNQFTGTIPDSFRQLKMLQFFFIQENAFTGSIEYTLNVTASPSLLNVDVSNNELTGTLPSSYFGEHNLSSFAASANCLSGSIPDEICHAKSLTGLSLDGLTTSPGCRLPIFPGVRSLNSFIVRRYMQGTIPYCLLALPLLQSLHLSGNGFTGSIPDNVNISHTLQDLSLSHNVLTGTIPSSMQTKSWINLALSYNKLTGTLNDNMQSIPSDGSLLLELNRLSGTLPTSILATEDIQILEGNIFTCNRDETNLPKNDPEAGNYSCGSDTVDRMLIAFGVVAGITFFLFVIYFSYAYQVTCRSCSAIRTNLQSFLSRLMRWKNALKEVSVTETGYNPCTNINNLSIFFSEIRKSFIIIALFILIVLCPLYYYISDFSNSYTVEYAWGISALLVSGQIPAVVLLLGFTGLIVLVFVIFNRLAAKTKGDLIFLDYSRASLRSTHQFSEASVASSNTNKNGGSSHYYFTRDYRKYLVYTIVFIVNVIVMLIIDFSYVYVVLNYELTVVVLSEILLAVVKIVLNNIILWNSLPLTHYFISDLLRKSDRPSISSTVWQLQRIYKYTPGDITFLEKIILYNNVVIPAFAIFIVSSDCFYYALYAASNIQSSYSYVTCHRYLGTSSICEKGGYQTQTTSITYSPPFIYGYQCSSKIGINYVAVFILMFVFVGIVIPMIKILMKLAYDRLPNGSMSRKYLEWMIPENLKDLVPDQPAFQKPVFAKLRMTSQINSYLAIMISFGGLFPPLAVLAAFAIILITYYEELNFGRILTESRKLGYSWYEEKLEEDCANIAKSMNLTLPPILFVTSLLFAYILFDTWGDEMGWQSALIPTFIMISIPIALLVTQVSWINYRNYQKKRRRSSIKGGGRAATTSMDNVEMMYEGAEEAGGNGKNVPSGSEENPSFSGSMQESHTFSTVSSLSEISRNTRTTRTTRADTRTTEVENPIFGGFFRGRKKVDSNKNGDSEAKMTPMKSFVNGNGDSKGPTNGNSKSNKRNGDSDTKNRDNEP
jgi:Leucine-rich repeat (LRR) protein